MAVDSKIEGLANASELGNQKKIADDRIIYSNVLAVIVQVRYRV
jgi:hypothetical protein